MGQAGVVGFAAMAKAGPRSREVMGWDDMDWDEIHEHLIRDEGGDIPRPQLTCTDPAERRNVLRHDHEGTERRRHGQ